MRWQQCRSLSRATGIVTAIAGCLVLAGWIFHIEGLDRIWPDWPAMRVNIALGYIGAGLSLAGYQPLAKGYTWPQKLRSGPLWLAAITASTGLFALYLYKLNAVSIALNFVGLGAALLNLHQRRYHLAQSLAIASFLLSLLELVSDFYALPSGANLWTGHPLTLNTSVIFATLALGILLAQPDAGWVSVITSPYAGGITARRLFPVVLGSPLLLGSLTVYSNNNMGLSSETASTTRSIINILILGSVTWWNARFLNTLDVKHQESQLALGQAYEQLEQQVAERTVELATANLQLQKNYQLLQSVINGISDPIFVKDQDGRFVLVNTATAQKFNLAAEAIVDCSDYDLHPPEVAQSLMENDAAIMASNTTLVLEEQVLQNGVLKTFLSTKSPWHDREGNVIGIIGVAKDISDRKQTEVTLKQQQELLQSIVDHIPIMLSFFDEDHRFQWVNREWERVTGWTLDEVKGHNMLAEFYPDPLYRQRVLNTIQAAEKIWEDFQIRIRDGRIVDTLWANLRLSDGTSIGIGQDISERKRAELALQDLNETLEQRIKDRTAELTVANQELEAFSYSVSHDLRTPLRGIDGFSKALSERYSDRLDEKGQHYLQRIRAGTQRMGQLIDALLALSQVTRVEMHRSTVNLSAIAHNIAHELAASQPERTVTWLIQDDILATGDARLLEVTLENLLSNAWKFTLTKAHPQIEFGVTVEATTSRKIYFVRDNGTGFDMAYVNKLFNAFQRLHSATEFPGTGIGLATVHRIIHRHGGNIWAESTPQQGATFSFTLGA